MKQKFIASLLLPALLAGGATALTAGNSEAVSIPPASAFNPIQRYDIAYDEPRDLAEFYLALKELRLRHADIALANHPSDVSMRVMLVTVGRIKSEAVHGVQWRFVLRANEGKWEAVEAGMRRKCNSGPNMGKWTRDVCP